MSEWENLRSGVTESDGDDRYVNADGDTMMGDLEFDPIARKIVWGDYSIKVDGNELGIFLGGLQDDDEHESVCLHKDPDKGIRLKVHGGGFAYLSYSDIGGLTSGDVTTLHKHDVTEITGQRESFMLGHNGSPQGVAPTYSPLEGPGRARSATWEGYTMPRAGSVTALTVAVGTAPSGLTYERYKVFKNGAALTTYLNLPMLSKSAYTTWSAGTYSFAAGDRLIIRASSSGLGTKAVCPAGVFEVEWD